MLARCLTPDPAAALAPRARQYGAWRRKPALGRVFKEFDHDRDIG